MTRVFVPALTELGIRIRKNAFYQTRHTYVSYTIPIGKKVAFVAEQVGDSIQRIETTYKKYFASDDDLDIPEQATGTEGTAKLPQTGIAPRKSDAA